MSAGKILLLVFGIIFVLVSFVMIVGGGIVLAVDQSLRDNQGFYNTGFSSLSASEPVIISRPADIEVNTDFFVRQRHPVTIRIKALDEVPGKQIFIGVAEQRDLQNYLNGVGNLEITGVTFFPFKLEKAPHAGGLPASPPTNQTFWVASATGSGTQTLEWDVASGTYSLIVMNADGSSPINTQISLGARVPEFIRAIGLGTFIVGILLLASGGVMIFFSVRK